VSTDTSVVPQVRSQVTSDFEKQCGGVDPLVVEHVKQRLLALLEAKLSAVTAENNRRYQAKQQAEALAQEQARLAADRAALEAQVRW
jgi:hypothetical protein